MMTHVQEVSIKSDTFEAFKEDFDAMLVKTLDNMREKDLEEAEITVKMTVKARKQEVNNPTRANLAEKRTAVVPTFAHKISTVYKVESKAEGQLANGFELVFDEDSGTYVLVEIDNGQTSMFNSTYETESQPINAEATIVEPRKALAAQALLPMEDEDDEEE